MPIYDLHCIECGRDVKDVYRQPGQWGRCELCNGPLTMTPFVFATDVYGAERCDDILEESPGRALRYTSAREREAKMRAIGFEPCGDKVHGGRDCDTGYKGKIFSDAGRARRSAAHVASGER